jgi:hypothetical protein
LLPDDGADAERQAREIENDLLKLLLANVAYGGWEHQTAEQKAFYVRGFTWFRERIINGRMSINDCVQNPQHIDTMMARVQSRPAWLSHSFDWDERLGGRQFVDAASIQRRKPLKFCKAVEVIALCETVADALHAADPSRPPGLSVYARMRIEPAVSFVHGFDASVMAQIEARPESAQELRRWTGQKSLDVFSDMAGGKTVTHKLALWTHNFLDKRFPSSRLGDVDCRYNPKRDYTPSDNEDFEVLQTDLPEEAQAGLGSGS